MAIINLSKGNNASLIGTVVAVDANNNTVNFCSAKNDGSSVVTNSVKFNSNSFDKEFFDNLTEIVKQEIDNNPDMDTQKVSLILPDQLFLLDTVNIPVIHKKAMQQSLSLAIEAVYQNAADLSLMTYAIQQNKQTATFGIVGIRRDILDLANEAFVNAGAPVTGITYMSNAMVDGAMALNAKLRNDSFMLIDIKKKVTRFAFVIRSCTMGYYDLPFGYEIMHRTRLVSEDTLFDHRAGKLLVLNAKEKARKKQLTTEASLTYVGVEGEDAELEISPETEVVKGSKRLPKFMQRPIPESEEEYVYENFRIFLKWALELINNNRDILSFAKLDTVYINMPDEFRFLFDVVNKKQAGRGLNFTPLVSEDSDAAATENLELYGGFSMSRFNEANNF